MRKNALGPTYQLEGEMTVDGLKVGFVACDHGGADATSRECDEDIEGQIAKLVRVEVFATFHRVQDLCCLDPMLLCRSQNLTAPQEIRHEPPLQSRSSPTEQLMQNDCRASRDKGGLQDAKGEPSGSEILDVDRGVQNGELSFVQRRLPLRRRYTAG